MSRRKAEREFANAVGVGPQGRVVEVLRDGGQPTRRQLVLRRRAANRSRVAEGQRPRPALEPGDCEGCGGWGVVGQARLRCPACAGAGD